MLRAVFQASGGLTRRIGVGTACPHPLSTRRRREGGGRRDGRAKVGGEAMEEIQPKIQSPWIANLFIKSASARRKPLVATR